MKWNYCLMLFALSLISCHKDDVSLHKEVNIDEIESTILGPYDSYILHHQTIALKDELCLISGNEIVIYPYDSSGTIHRIEDPYNFNGVVVNEFDTIVHRGKTFYRFYPSKKEFSPIHTSTINIYDFCVTPNHGIGYFSGNLFVESLKFNYFDFRQNRNQVLFTFSEFIPDKLGPYREYQTHFINDELFLFMRTGNNSNPLSTTGVFYDINLDKVKIQSRVEYQNKLELKILEYNHFKNINISYGIDGQGEVAIYNWLTTKANISYRFPINWLHTAYFISGDYLSLSPRSLSSVNTTEFINWKTSDVIFSVSTPEKYRTGFAGIKHYKNEYLLLYSKRNNEALIYDNLGRNTIKLIAKENIQEIMHLDSEKVITRNDQNKIEYFKLP